MIEYDDGEEFFIVRYNGPKANRDEVMNYIAGNSADYYRYSTIIKDAEVTRASTLGDILKLVNVKQEVVDEEPPPLLPMCSERMPAVFTHYPQETTSDFMMREVKPEVREPEFEKRVIANAIAEATSSAATGGFMRVPTPLSFPKHPPRPKIHSVRRIVPRYQQPKPQVMKRPAHKILKTEFAEREDEEYVASPDVFVAPKPVELALCRPVDKTRIVTSQTLKQHNISFERKK